MLEAQGEGHSLTDQDDRCPKGNYEVVFSGEMVAREHLVFIVILLGV